MKYDAAEAGEIAARIVEAHASPAQIERRRAAADELVAELITVAQAAGLKAEKRPSGRIVEVRRWVSAPESCNLGEDNGWWYEAPRPVPGQPPRSTKLAIVYNPSTNLFEGTEDDTYRVPVPGQRRAKRSALAVLMDACERVLGQPQQGP